MIPQFLCHFCHTDITGWILYREMGSYEKWVLTWFNIMHKSPAMWMPVWCLSLILQFSGLWTDTADWQGMRRLHWRLLNALKWEYSLALMLPIAKWTCTPPHTHTHMHTASVHPYPTPTHTVSQLNQCEYMNTLNCSDRVNYSVLYQATKHQNALWLPCEYKDQQACFGTAWRQVWYFSRQSL